MSSTVTFWKKTYSDYEYNIIHHNLAQSKIEYHDDYSTIDDICEDILEYNIEDANKLVPVALKIECKPNYDQYAPMNPIAVIQLAINSNLCYVFSIMPYIIPESLAEILDHWNVRLIGCGIKNHCQVLKQNFRKDLYFNNMENNALELSPYIYGNGFSCKSTDIFGIAKDLLDIKVRYDQNISLSNWENTPLTDDQICHAAMDVYVPIKTFFMVKRSF